MDDVLSLSAAILPFRDNKVCVEKVLPRIFQYVKSVIESVQKKYEWMMELRNVVSLATVEKRDRYVNLILSARKRYFELYDFVLRMDEMFPEEKFESALPLLGDTEILFEEMGMCVRTNLSFAQIIVKVIADRVDSDFAYNFFVCANYYAGPIIQKFAPLILNSRNEKVRVYGKIFNSKNMNEYIEIQKECGNVDGLRCLQFEVAS